MKRAQMERTYPSAGSRPTSTRNLDGLCSPEQASKTRSANGCVGCRGRGSKRLDPTPRARGALCQRPLLPVQLLFPDSHLLPKITPQIGKRFSKTHQQ